MPDYGYLTRLWRSNTIIWQNKLSPICSSFGVTYVDRVILDELSIRGPQTKRQLAENLGTIHQNLTRSIKRLQEQHLVSATEVENDMRRLKIEITKQGLIVNRNINDSINKEWEKILLNASSADLKAFTKILELGSEPLG